jgi:hypothetical protein
MQIGRKGVFNMKKLASVFLIAIILFTQFLLTPTAANAATTLQVKASIGSGVYYATTGIKVSLSTNPGSTIVYTTDGSQPQAKRVLYSANITHGTKYTGPITITGNMKIRAIAIPFDILIPVSAEAVFTYEVYNPVTLGNSVTKKFTGFNYKKYDSAISYIAKDGSKGGLNENYSSGSVNCTWLTFVRSQYNTGRDVLFSSAGGINGKYWYDKLVANSSQLKYGGSNGLENLISAMGNRPIYNVIVSFPNGGDNHEGHVLLIDAIINGKFYYSDNFHPGTMVTSNSVADFKKKYANSGTIIGVVHLTSLSNK